MLYKNGVFKALIIFCLVSTTLFTRFYGLNWGDHYYFNPDENNMAISISQLSFNNLNPHFFAYGQFPLYLVFISAQLINFIKSRTFVEHVNFENAIFVLRFWSAFFSSLSVFLLYLIGKKIFKNIFNNLLFIFLIIFTPGLIQFAHFGTTESLLIFVFVFNIYISLKFIKDPKIGYIFLAALISGIGLSSKITALAFLSPIYLSIKKNTLLFLMFTSFTTLFFIIFSPYNFIDNLNFRSSINYETAVATGKLSVFYTRQFIDTKPYLFQFTNILPYVLGLPVFVLSIIGFAYLAISKKIFKVENLIVIIPSLIYFLYIGQLFTKWTRFMSPIFFLFPLLAIYLISLIKNKILGSFLTLICIIPGVIFMSNYFYKDTRIVFSNWMESNISVNAKVLSESGNVVNIPVSNKPFNVVNFDFYNLDQDISLQSGLPNLIQQSDYIIVPSRRMFKNQTGPNFPISQAYYRHLFSGDLGFSLTKIFKPSPDFFLNSENAEETWSVFDRPTIRVFKKDRQLSIPDIKNFILGNG